MFDRILIYVGSYTLKAYQMDGDILIKKSMVSLLDKNITTFDYAQELKKNIQFFINLIKKKNMSAKIEIYASNIFKKLYDGVPELFVSEFYNDTSYYFNILDKHIERMYLKHSLNICSNKSYYILKIGGQVLEIIYVGKKYKVLTLKFGISDIISYNKLLSEDSPISLAMYTELKDYVMNVIEKKIKKFIKKNEADTMYYISGEASFLKNIGYDLDSESISQKEYINTLKNFCCNTKLSDISINYKNNTSWLLGSRACCIIAIVVIELLDCSSIFPKDEDISDGICKQRYIFMLIITNVVDDNLKHIINEYENEGTICWIITEQNIIENYEFLHYLIICDIVFVYNIQELSDLQNIFIGQVFSHNKKVLFYKKPSENIVNIFPLEYVIID